MDNSLKNTILFLFAMSFLGTMMWFVVWDYLRSRRGAATASKMALALWKAKRAESVSWLVLGLFLGIGIGLVIGVILGHLFWPQFA